MARAKNIVSVARNIGLVFGLVGLSACSVVQENPNYQYSSKYQDRINTSYASNGIATTPATYTTASTETYSGQVYAGSTTTRAAEAECRNKESNREIIGGAAGGAIGAFAGDRLIGGTAGTLAGAAIGGAAGYGLGDISVDCSPDAIYQPAPVQAATQTYQPAPVQTYEAAPAPVYQPEPATYSAAAPVIAAPTDTIYSDQVVTGTPGYAIFQGEGLQTVEEAAAISQSSAVASNSYVTNPHASNVHTGIQSAGTLHGSSVQTNGATEIIDYDYSANLITADTAISSQGVLPSETRLLGGNAAYQSYVVQPGDTVYGLSRKLCASVTDIQTQNNIDANYGIKIGQTINLPQNRC